MPAFQHHPEPALQEQDLPNDLLVQCLLEGLPLRLLQKNLEGMGTGVEGWESCAREALF